MIAFRICGEDDELLRVEQGEHGPGLYLRDCVVPLSPLLSEPFKVCQFTTLWQNGGVLRVKDGEPLVLGPSSLRESRRLLGSSTGNARYWGPALLHVCLPHRREGKVTLWASSYGEAVVSSKSGRRVIREYLPLEDAGGITIRARSEDEEEALLEVLPGACFRIERELEGTLPEESPILVVSWTGTTLRISRPSKYREEVQEQQNAEDAALTG